IGRLSHLDDLDVSYNELSALPPTMKDLRNLRELNLEGNSLVALSTYLGFLPHLEILAAYNMPSLRFPPPEVVEQGSRAMLAYLRERHGEEKPGEIDM
ncbi:MAG: GTPase, partial [Ktedonobacteraceae bacterium]